MNLLKYILEPSNYHEKCMCIKILIFGTNELWTYWFFLFQFNLHFKQRLRIQFPIVEEVPLNYAQEHRYSWWASPNQQSAECRNLYHTHNTGQYIDNETQKYSFRTFREKSHGRARNRLWNIPVSRQQRYHELRGRTWTYANILICEN